MYIPSNVNIKYNIINSFIEFYKRETLGFSLVFLCDLDCVLATFSLCVCVF